jgi:predicted O-methyltransferase YrrM
MTLHAQYTARAGGSWSEMRDHLDFLYAQANGRLALAELGVRKGHSTCALLAGLEAAGSGHLWSVDIAPPQVPAGWEDLPYWHFLQADDLSRTAREHIPEKLDLLFIDTSHSYDHTLAELAVYAPRVIPGGVILMHDTRWAPGDIELPAPTGPVAGALDTWCRMKRLAWENLPGSYGMGMIKIPAAVRS